MKKILLLGSRGFLGTFLVKYCPKDVNLIVSARDRKHIPPNYEFISIDILEKEDLIKKFTEIHPDIVINAAANALPDVAEDKKDWTYAVNVTGVANIIEGCKKIGCKLIQISTDYVFSGEKGNYKENDEVGPVNYYGVTKLEAEKLVKESNLQYLICRTSVLYGLKEVYHHNILFNSIYDKLKDGQKIEVSETQIGCPTLVDDLALCIFNMIDFDHSDVYHTASAEAISRYNYALKLTEIFNLDKNLIIPIRSKKSKAIRPKDSSLNTSKLIRDYDIKFRSVEEGLKFIKKQLEK